jgi:hypothetical protein
MVMMRGMMMRNMHMMVAGVVVMVRPRQRGT